jgi:hypothetical protein
MLSFFFLVAVWGAKGLVRGDEYYEGEWRRTLDVCWVDRSCNRVMNVVHGGDWGLDYPYDSLPAFQRANAKGADAVKGDFRVSKGLIFEYPDSNTNLTDNIGMVMHSSPVEVYESFDCFNKKVDLLHFLNRSLFVAAMTLSCRSRRCRLTSAQPVT